MQKSLFAISAAVLVALLSACPGPEVDPDPNPPPDGGVKPVPTAPGTAKFSQWNAEERAGAVSLAAGDGAAAAMTNLFLADLDAEFGECPQRKVLDGTFVYGASGGCTTGADVTYMGTITAMNAHRFNDEELPYDPTKPTRAEFFDFVRSDAETSMKVDGLVVQTPGAQGGYAFEMDLTFGAAPLVVSVKEGMTCTQATDHTACAITAGASGKVEGKGTFVVRGELKTFSNGYGGWLELEGQDLMRVDFSPERLCNPVKINGAAAGEICRDPVEPPPPPSSIEITGAGLLCGSDAYTALATVKGDPQRVYVQLASATASEEFELVKGDLVEGTDEFVWRVDIVPGVDSQFDCQDFEVIGAKFVSEKDDESDCYVGNEGSESPWQPEHCQ